MAFRYYITDLYEGTIVGTDDSAEAQNFALVEDFFVVDTQTNMWLLSNGTQVLVEPAAISLEGN